ncbi:MAG: hypothetical protein ACK4NN_13245, partial [Rheinheimera sp.]
HDSIQDGCNRIHYHQQTLLQIRIKQQSSRNILTHNVVRTGGKPLAVWHPSGRRPRVTHIVSEPCSNQHQPCNLKTNDSKTTKPRCRLRVVGARRQRFELLFTALSGQLRDENRRCENERAKPPNVPQKRNCTELAFAS